MRLPRSSYAGIKSGPLRWLRDCSGFRPPRRLEGNELLLFLLRMSIAHYGGELWGSFRPLTLREGFSSPALPQKGKSPPPLHRELALR